MEKYFNHISVVTGLIGGMAAKYLGGWDLLLKALLFLMVVDYFSGIAKAIYKKNLSSEQGFKGIIKKILILVMVVTACTMDTLIGGAVPLREIVLFFYISNEILSLIENAAEIIPIPEQMKDVLIQIREKGGK